MTSPRSLDGDRKMVSDSLRVLEQVAARTEPWCISNR